MHAQVFALGFWVPYLFILAFLWSHGCILSVSAVPEGPHINTLNVLLPPKTTRPVRFRLQGSGGCFSWSWDRRDIIHVKAEYNGTEICSNSAVITSIAPYDGRKVTSVYATDTLTGQVIRCEVFIDKISRVQISHHSLKLDLDGLATLRVLGFDMEDNMFSSLVGIQFMWRLLPSRSSSGHSSHSLTHVPLKRTPLSDCGCLCGDIDTQIELEDKGLGSDLFVVRGMEVGQERVSVNVLEPSMEGLEDEIILTVAEAIFLEPPSPVYVLVGTVFQYILKTLRDKTPSVIQLPSRNHYWSVTNASVAEVDSVKGTVVTQNYGNIYVIVEDIRVPNYHQFSSLYVVIPSSLQLLLTPLTFKATGQQPPEAEISFISSDIPWFLVAGWDYVVQVLAFSPESGSRPLYLTQGNLLNLSFDGLPYWKSISIPEDVRSEQGWQNGTLIKAISEGTGWLYASLRFQLSLEDNQFEVLTVKQEVFVCHPVIIQLEDGKKGDKVILPWDPKVIQEYELRVQGGCGTKPSDYRWLSLDPAVVSVNSLGLVRAKGLSQGVIRAMALTNPLNADEVVVEVSCPSSIAKIEGLAVEAEIGSFIPAGVTLKGPEGIAYSKCKSFSSLIDWRLLGGEGLFEQANNTDDLDYLKNGFEDFGPLCGWTYFLAIRPGRATVSASLALDCSLKTTSLAASENILSVSWTLAAYAPLSVLQIGVGHSYGGYHCGTVAHLENIGSTYEMSQCQVHEMLLVPGSSMKVMLKGGPERWGQGVDFLEGYDILSDNSENESKNIEVSHLTIGGRRLYDITCVSLGNYTLMFYRGNSAGPGHAKAVLATVKLSVICSLPSSITLLIDATDYSLEQIKASSQADRDQNRLQKNPVTVVGGRSLKVAVVALGANGSPFANASSLPLSWSLEGCASLGYWEGHNISVDHIQYGQWEETLVLKDGVGECLVRATVGSLNERWFSQLPNQESFFSKMELLIDAVKLQVVSSLSVDPNFVLLYHHFSAKANLVVHGGSSLIEAHSNDTRVAVVLEQPLTPKFAYMTIGARGLGNALITIWDVGLTSPASVAALVRVSEVAWVRLLLPDEVTVEIGSLLMVKVQAGDSLGNSFDESQLDFMDIRVHIKDEALELVHRDEHGQVPANKVSGSSFILRGANVGITDLYVSARPQHGHEILSELYKVEVYSPLSIHPEGLVLAPGAQYMVSVHGGPSVGAFLSFMSSNVTILSVENVAGLIAANSPGIASIYAQAQTHGGTIVCKAALEVRVRIPVSMLLNVRSGQLAIGREMSIFPTGAQEDLLSFFELCRNYTWIVEEPQVLALHSGDGTTGWVGKEGPENDELRLSRSVDARFSTMVAGRSAGKTQISVGFSCHFVSKTGFSSTRSYIASASIHVLPDPPLALGIPATWVLPQHYKTSSLLPQATDQAVDTPVQGKHNIVYSILQESGKDLGSIVLEGSHIKTSERKDTTCVQSRDRRTGRCEVAVCVRVAEVSQMTLANLKRSSRAAEISVGASQLYSVIHKDNLGVPFYEVGNAVTLTAETNRMDLISVRVLNEENGDFTGNSTVLVQALRQGTALIRISQLRNPSAVDYVLIHVGAFINPRNPVLHVGGQVNFSLAGKGSTEHGKWLSSNHDVLKVDENTGEGIAVSAGLASVSYNSSHLMAYTTATVIQITSISIKPPEGQINNVGVPEEGYLFYVTFSDQQGQDVGLVARHHKVAYMCHIEPSFIGRCFPWVDFDEGKAYCVFCPYPPERLFLTMQTLREDAISNVTVDVKGFPIIKMRVEALGTPEVGYVSVPFAGGFTILDNPKKLYLAPTTNSTKLTILGNAGVELSWTRTDALDIKRLNSEKDTYGYGGQAVFEVKVIDDKQPFSSDLTFTLPTTGQAERVRVEYDVKERQNGALPQKILTAAIVTLILVVLPLIACARLLDIPRRVQQEGRAQLEPSSETRPRSPVSLSPSMQPNRFETPQPVSSSRSPPQPYTEYVSKTIEKTPYFKRGVRLFDPSRTY